MSLIQDQIVSTANQYGVDPALALAVANQESGFQQSAVSPAGAIGVFQLMPSTAAGLGVDPTTLDGNIKGGVIYLSQMLDQFGGNVPLALAAYNAGPGNVNKYGGIPPFQETQNYVTNITGSIGQWASYVSTAVQNVVSGVVGDITGTGPGGSTDGGSSIAGLVVGAIGIGLGIVLLGRIV